MKFPRSFARTISHSLSERQRQMLDINASFKLSEFISKKFQMFYLEIGFGSGENLLRMASERAEVGFIGAEPFVNGAVKVVTKILDDGIPNIFVHIGDISDILDQIPDGFISRCFILFPDPWPKKKQRKRRLVNSIFLVKLLKKVSGETIFATDDPDYFSEVVKTCKAQGIQYDILKARPKELAESKYERKALDNGRCPEYLKINSHNII